MSSDDINPQWGSSFRLAASEKWKTKSAVMGRDVTEALVEFAKPSPGMKVLDLASGTGEPAVTLAARVGPAGHVTALDLTELENCSKSPPSAPVTGASRISRPSRPTRNPCRSPPTASIWAHAASVSCSSPTWNAPSVNCTAFSNRALAPVS